MCFSKQFFAQTINWIILEQDNYDRSATTQSQVDNVCYVKGFISSWQCKFRDVAARNRSGCFRNSIFLIYWKFCCCLTYFKSFFGWCTQALAEMYKHDAAPSFRIDTEAMFAVLYTAYSVKQSNMKCYDIRSYVILLLFTSHLLQSKAQKWLQAHHS